MGDVLDHWRAAIPISVNHIKFAGAAAADSKDMRNLIAKINACLTECLTALNPAKIQCNIASVSTKSLSLAEPEKYLHRFASLSEHLHIWLHEEKELSALLCELAFGGTGVEQGEDEEQRPVTKLEERVMRRTLESIADGIAAAASGLSGFNFEREAQDEKNGNNLADQNLQFVEIKILINAFASGYELSVLLLADELAQILKNHHFSQSEGSIFEIVGDCEFHLEALLPGDSVPLADLLALKPGAILRLTHKVDTGVVVRCGEQVIFNGDYEASSDAVAMQLITLRHPATAVPSRIANALFPSQ